MKLLFSFIYLYIILLSFSFSFGQTTKNNSTLESVRQKLTSDFFTRLYSNTYYSLISRIEADGYLQESMTGQYDGEYCRTVGAMVPLLVETKNYEKAELMLKFVFQTMKANGMKRVPHVIGKKIHKVNQTRDSVYIIGKTDQIDGQVHNILAWAKLALARGHTLFEDSTWNLVSDLMDRSTEEPYFGSNKNGFIPELIFNFNFEHSRPIPTNYDLLTQCFVGAALTSMIKVAVTRNDVPKAKRWTERLNNLKFGIEKYMTRKVDGKQVYLELLSKDKNDNKPFFGYSWVNLSPIAAQWSPLNFEVLRNTIKEMEKHTIQEWNNIKWIPTEWWPNGDFSGQIIGKGIGWEIEFNREIKNWKRINEMFSMLKTVQGENTIFMENSFLTTGSNQEVPRMNKSKLDKMKYGIWKIVDQGNGEQAAWWCWAIARLRIGLGLSAVPKKLSSIPQINILKAKKTIAEIEIKCQPGESIFYTIDGTEPSLKSIKYNGIFNVDLPAKIKAAAYNANQTVSNISSKIVLSPISGLEYSCFEYIDSYKNFKWLNNEESYTGYSYNFDLKNFSIIREKFGISWNGFLKLRSEGDFKFYIIASCHAKLIIDGNNVSVDVNSISNKQPIKNIYLKKGIHKLELIAECIPPENNFEIYFSLNNKQKELVDSSMLLTKFPADKNILPPQILPFKPEFDIQDSLYVTINSFDNSEIFYTLDGSDPTKKSLKYEKPIKINSSLTVKAVVLKDDDISPVSIMNYKQTENIKIDLNFQPSPKYKAIGSATLIDGIYGSTNLNDGKWLGFEGNDLDAAFDLRKEKVVNEIEIGFLNNPGSWIFLPKEIKFFVSSDGKKYKEIYDVKPD